MNYYISSGACFHTDGLDPLGSAMHVPRPEGLPFADFAPVLDCNFRPATIDLRECTCARTAPAPPPSGSASRGLDFSSYERWRYNQAKLYSLSEYESAAN